jgi:DnaB-like helicase N terminal domain/AAA domain
VLAALREPLVAEKFQPLSPEEFAARVEGQPQSPDSTEPVTAVYTNGPTSPSKRLEPPEHFYREHDNVVDIQSASDAPLPPFDMDAEAAVLSSLLLQPQELAKVSQLLSPESFYSEAHRRIFEAVLSVAAKDRDVDVITVASELRESERLRQVGGLAYLTSVVNAAPAVTHIDSYVSTVRELAYRRSVILACQKASAVLYIEKTDVLAVVDDVRKTLDLAPTANIVLSTEDLFKPLSEPNWLVPVLGIAPGAPTMIAGYGWSGKSLMAQSIAVAVATGSLLWNQFTTRKGRVLHLDFEQGTYLTSDRYQRIAYGKQLKKEDFESRLEAIAIPDFNFAGSNCRDILCRFGENRDLVIIDSLRASTHGLDENQSEISKPLVASLHASEKTGCVFTFIHHETKNGSTDGDARKKPRGHGSIFDASGCQIAMEAPQEFDDPIIVRNTKARALRNKGFRPFNFYIDDFEDGAGIVFRYEQLDKDQVVKKRNVSRDADRAHREAVEEARRAERAARDLVEKTRQDREDEQIATMIIRKSPGVSKYQLRVKMGTSVPGGCGRGRIDMAIERLIDSGVVVVDRAARGELLHYLAETKRRHVAPPKNDERDSDRPTEPSGEDDES